MDKSEKKNDEVNLRKVGIKGNSIVIVFSVILMILLVGISCYKIMFDKNVFNILVNNSFDYLEKAIVDSKSISGNFTFKVNNNNGANDNVYGIIDRVSLIGTYGIDYKNRIVNLDLKSKYDGNKLVNANLYIEDGNEYVFFEDVYDRYINISDNNFRVMLSNMDKKNDIKVMLDAIGDAVNSSLKKKYFKSSTERVDGKSLNKLVLNLSYNNYKEIKRSVCDKLVSNKKFLNSYSNIVNRSIADIRDMVNDEAYSDNGFYGGTISIYTTKGISNEFIKMVIEKDDNKISITKGNNTYNFEVVLDRKVVYDGEVKIINKDKVNVYKVSFNDKETNNSIEFTINNYLKYNGAVKKINVSNSVNYDEITAQDKNNIYSKLTENDAVMEMLRGIKEKLIREDDVETELEV